MIGADDLAQILGIEARDRGVEPTRSQNIAVQLQPLGLGGGRKGRSRHVLRRPHPGTGREVLESFQQ